LYKPTLKNSKN